jgi:hypothetical protein
MLQVKVVEQLLELGANIGAQDRFGGTPLDDALREGHEEVTPAPTTPPTTTTIPNPSLCPWQAIQVLLRASAKFDEVKLAFMLNVH